MPKAEGRVFDFLGEEHIKKDFLETFEYKGEPQVVTIETDEFSAVCPFSGLPDIGKLTVIYVPHGKCIELKSLKYYLISYRNVGVYQERATTLIYEHLKEVLRTERLYVSLTYNTRGGINTKTEVGRNPKQEN